MGLRLLFLIIALLLVLLIVRFFLRQRANRAAQRETRKVENVDMVQCAYCGVHLPEPEAIYDAPDYYCCKEHHSNRKNAK